MNSLFKWFSVVLLAIAPTAFAQQSTLWPDWVFAPTSDYADTHLYAVGFGDSKTAARQHALAEIALQVSVDVNALQRSLLARSDGVVTDSFAQTSVLEALGVALERIEERRSAVLYEGEDSQVAVLLAVAKESIIASLHDQVRPFESLSFPFVAGDDADSRAQNATAQLLWALQYRQQVNDALRIERAMAALHGGQPMLRMQLQQLQRDAQAVWQVAGVRVIADRAIEDLAGALSAQLPTAPDAVLWIRLTQQQQRASRGTDYFERRELMVHVSPASNPTRVLHQHTLQVTGSGRSPTAAAHSAQQQLIEQLDRPLSVWLFD